MTMKSYNSKAVLVGASMLMTILAGAPAIADDTELLLVDPSNSAATPPNIMFILDTSGSMNDPANTIRPFDSEQVYTTGDCDPDRLYWTTLDAEPSCTGGTNEQYIVDAAFVCEDAILRMKGMGAYTGVLMQYRSTDDDDSDGTLEDPRWQQLQIGNSANIVECQNDAGEHGNGTAGQVYARSGTDLTPFTADENEAIQWGAGDATQEYTIYDGNYLNWKENQERVDMPKIDIMKQVTTNLMNSIENVNVGLMRFTGSDGGRVLHAISDLDTDRQVVLDKIDALAGGGNTPLEETLYESALYWRGMTANYGVLQVDVNGDPTGDIDPNAFVGQAPSQYQQPTMPVCTRNFNVLLSDGEPVSDQGAQTLAPLLPSYSTIGHGAVCDGAEANGRCLNDVAEYLAKVDIHAGTPGMQNVITHTIGFARDIDVLQDAASDSGGTYYLAEDAEELTRALMRIIETSLDKGLSFSAPAVAVNTFNRTQNFNDLYISTFLPDGRVHWPGNLKKYKVVDGVITDADDNPAVDPETGYFATGTRSIWTVGLDDGDNVTRGGAANKLPPPLLRNVYTNNGTSNDLTNASNAVSPANASSFTLSDFGLTGGSTEPTLDDVLRWARGQDVLDDDDDDDSDDERFVMGDSLHSMPAAVVYGGTTEDPEVVVFSATNDGYLHAIDGETGVELWSFVPKQFLPDLPELMLNGSTTFKQYGIDGDVVPIVADLDDDGIINNDDFVYVVFGLRRGGNDYYALDVTDKDSPELLWKKSFPESGQSWSRPVLARVDMVHDDLNDHKAVLVIGEGYDTVHDTAAFPSNADNVGAGIMMLDIETGERLWRAGLSNADLTLSTMTRAFPSEVRVIDFSGDGFADRMYAVDVGGQVWRFDIFSDKTPAELVAGGVIARFGGEGIASAGDTDTRRFYTAPDVSIFQDKLQDRRMLAIGVGSGYRAHPLDTSAADAYYSLRDAAIFTQLTQNAYDNYDIAEDSDMREVTGQVGTVIGSNDRGWKLTVPANQMILSGSATFDNSVFFISYEPNLVSLSSCDVAPGINYLYRVDVANGDPIGDIDGMTGAQADAARTTALKQGGIAPTPTFLFPGAEEDCTGDECSPPPIGCVGVECFNPGFENFPVRTLWTQDGIE